MSWASSITNIQQAAGIPSMGFPNIAQPGSFASSPMDATLAPYGGWPGFRNQIWASESSDPRQATNVDVLMGRYATPQTKVDQLAQERDRQTTINHRRRAKIFTFPGKPDVRSTLPEIGSLCFHWSPLDGSQADPFTKGKTIQEQIAERFAHRQKGDLPREIHSSRSQLNTQARNEAPTRLVDLPTLNCLLALREIERLNAMLTRMNKDGANVDAEVEAFRLETLDLENVPHFLREFSYDGVASQKFIIGNSAGGGKWKDEARHTMSDQGIHKAIFDYTDSPTTAPGAIYYLVVRRRRIPFSDRDLLFVFSPNGADKYNEATSLSVSLSQIKQGLSARLTPERFQHWFFCPLEVTAVCLPCRESSYQHDFRTYRSYEGLVHHDGEVIPVGIVNGIISAEIVDTRSIDKPTLFPTPDNLPYVINNYDAINKRRPLDVIQTPTWL
jgi:hypothetical protein